MVIVGGGLAGVSAAVEAVKAKATVTLLEKAHPRIQTLWHEATTEVLKVKEVCHETHRLSGSAWPPRPVSLSLSRSLSLSPLLPFKSVSPLSSDLACSRPVFEPFSVFERRLSWAATLQRPRRASTRAAHGCRRHMAWTTMCDGWSATPS